MRKFTAESTMEENLIKQLVYGESQWTYREDLKNEEDLWKNFRQKLSQNNNAILSDNPLTDQEFEQIKTQLNFQSPYEAAKWIAGENGIAQVRIQREDATLGSVSLIVMNNREIAGGMSTYEVINQFTTTKRTPNDRQRRFDVTLLINGLPMIHIELKNRREGYMKGYNQIQKYLKEGKFTGIYSAVQMFVVTNGTDTRYFAAARGTELNPKFMMRWVDKDNKRINNYLDFARHALSIPQAHRMIAHYTVIDDDKRALIILRPYQIHAVEAVKKASWNRESGYVWHTTGSGKTLTSYNVAKNLLHIPRLDKVIFIVDRVDLDQQTASSFQSYSHNDTISVEETDSVQELIKKLKNNERNLIITTIQKLSIIMRYYKDDMNSKNAKILRNTKVSFVVDECHRAVTPQKHREINSFFPNALWYGFTGTPIFVENARQEVGDLARTTEELYGKRLHEYTVKEAIGDNAVLGFQVEYNQIISDNDLREIVTTFEKTSHDLTIEDIEKKAPKEVYDDEEYRLKVIDHIINRSQNKFNLSGGPGNTFSAILTTDSIDSAKKYYDLFKEVINEKNTRFKVDEKVRKQVLDFPKVGITYSLSETEENSFKRQVAFQEVLDDYNDMYGTSFDMSSIAAYNRDLNNRLARKRSEFQFRENQIDIVIVVDRLLTGFDSPPLALLFMDRNPMPSHNTIQAFSRTNRIYNEKKLYGQIVTFRSPNSFKKSVQDAFILYSNGGENEIQAPTWEQALNRFRSVYQKLFDLIDTPDDVDNFRELNDMKLFANTFQEFDKSLVSISVYSDFDQDKFYEEYGLSNDLLEDLHGKYENVLDRIRELVPPDDELIDFDINYQLSTISKEQIDYDYLMLLLQNIAYKRAKISKEHDEAKWKELIKEFSIIEKNLEKFQETNPELAERIREAVYEPIKTGEYKDINVYKTIEDINNKTISDFVKEFTKKYSVGENELEYIIENYDTSKEVQLGDDALRDSSNYDDYKSRNESPVRKLGYMRLIRDKISSFISEKVEPYKIKN